MYICVNIDAILFIHFDILNSSKGSLLSAQILIAEILFGRAAPTNSALVQHLNPVRKKSTVAQGSSICISLDGEMSK